MNFWVALILIAMAFISMVFGIGGFVQHERFIFRPRNLRAYFIYRAIRYKRFWPGPQFYGYRQLESNEFGTVWEIPETLLLQAVHFVPHYSFYDVTRRDVRARQRILEVHDTTTGHMAYIAVPRIRSTSTPKGAVAWTFNMTEDEYQPLLET